jgi:hypothetical protein
MTLNAGDRSFTCTCMIFNKNNFNIFHYCREITACAHDIWKKYLSEDGICDYLQVMCSMVANRLLSSPAWADDEGRVL